MFPVAPKGRHDCVFSQSSAYWAKVKQGNSLPIAIALLPIVKKIPVKYHSSCSEQSKIADLKSNAFSFHQDRVQQKSLTSERFWVICTSMVAISDVLNMNT